MKQTSESSQETTATSQPMSSRQDRARVAGSPAPAQMSPVDLGQRISRDPRPAGRQDAQHDALVAGTRSRWIRLWPAALVVAIAAAGFGVAAVVTDDAGPATPAPATITFGDCQTVLHPAIPC